MLDNTMRNTGAEEKHKIMRELEEEVSSNRCGCGSIYVHTKEGDRYCPDCDY